LRVPARAYDIDILSEGYFIGGSPAANENVVAGQLNTMLNDSAKVEFSVDSITIAIREKPRVEFTSFDNYIDMECGDDTELNNLPVLEQYKLYPDIKVAVFEGPGATCPLDTGTLMVTVGTKTLPDLPISNGKAEGFLLKGGFPNFNTPFTMNMSINARDALNQNAELGNQEFITIGSQSKGTDFVSLSPELPFLVLHDPPTDQGAAFWESSSDVSTTSTTFVNHSEGGGASTALHVGAKFKTGVSVFGVFFAIITEAVAITEGSLSAIHTTNSSLSSNITTTITEKISTSARELFIGNDADIVMTMIMSKTFSESDILEKEGCAIVKTTDFATSKDSISAISYRTIKDIRDEIIPDLDTIMANEPDPEKTKGFEFSIKQWKDIIAANEEEKRRTFVDNPSDSLRHIAIGSGVDLDYSRGSVTSYSTSFEYIMEIDEELAVGAKVLTAGNCAEGKVFGKFRQEFTTEPTVEDETTETITTGFSLSDGDIGDQYLIAVYKDSRYGTPMFNVIGGCSSCPYVAYNEEAPLARTKLYSITEISDLIANDADLTTGTQFEFEIFNNSSSDIEFLVQKDFAFGQSSEVRINSSLDNLVAQNVVSGKSAKVMVAVKRTVPSGPDNETVKIRIAPNCNKTLSPEFEKNNEESLTFSVNYASTISPITMVFPGSRPTVDIASDNNLKIKMTEYVKANFDNLVLQYAKQGTGSLKDAINFSFTNEIFESNNVLCTIQDWDLSEVTEDGRYDIKLKTTKNGPTGSNGSGLVTILIDDRQKPQFFGIPEPVDDHYDQTENDVLSVSYNENVKASTSGVTVMIEDIVNGGPPIA
jgi:hypothetical protein